MELSPRLAAVAAWVPRGARVADIGTDHALLPVWLLEQGIASGAIAADLRPGPLEAARRTVQKHGLTGRISFRLCDGLSGVLPHEADTVVIAGMGGETILGILSAAPWTRDAGIQLLLQPQSAFPELRGWLVSSGYQIRRERIVREGNRFYVILDVTAGGGQRLSAGELWVGRQSADPLRGADLDWMAGVLDRAREGKRRSGSFEPDDVRDLQQALTEIRQMKKEWEAWL